MAKSLSKTSPSPEPTPSGVGLQVVVRIQPGMLDALDEWRRKQKDLPTRAEAIRRFIEKCVK